MNVHQHGDRTPRGHDRTLLRELQELTPSERIARNCQMVKLVKQLQAAGEKARGSERDLPRPG